MVLVLLYENNNKGKTSNLLTPYLSDLLNQFQWVYHLPSHSQVWVGRTEVSQDHQVVYRIWI